MNDVTTALKSLHDTYVQFTGLKLEFTFQRLHAWELWQARGWGQAELVLVLGFLKEAMKSGRRWSGAMGFRCLIEKTDVFEEHLAEARARGRIPKVDKARAEVLRATGRLGERKPMARSAEQVLRDEAAFTKFKEWRAANGL